MNTYNTSPDGKTQFDANCDFPRMTVACDENQCIARIVSGSQEMLFGHSLQGLAGIRISNLADITTAINWEQAEKFAKNIQKAYQKKRNVFFHISSVSPNGEVYYGCYAVYRADGKVDCQMMPIDAEDVEEKDNVVEEDFNSVPARNCSRSLLETVFESLPLGLKLYDRDGTLIRVNESDVKMMGVCDKSDLLGSNLFEDSSVPKEVKQRLRIGEDLDCVFEYDFDLARQYVHTSLTGKMHVEVKSTVLRDAEGNIDKYLLIVQDITAKVAANKLSEEALLKFEYLFDSLEAGVAYYGVDGELLEVNRYMVELLGVSDKEVLHATKTNLYTKKYFTDKTKASIRRGEKSRSFYEYDFDSVTKSGWYATSKQGKMDLNIRTSPVFNKQGELIGTIVVMIDRTETAQLQKKYERLYNQNRTILQSLPVGVEIYSPEGIMQYLNDRDCEIFGVNRDEALSEMSSVDDNPNLSDEIKQAVRNKEKIQANFAYDFSKVRESGYYNTSWQNDVRWIDCKGSPIFDSNGKLDSYVFIVNDITDYHNQSILLEEARQNLMHALKAGDVSAWTLDLDTNAISVLTDDSWGQSGCLDDLLAIMHPEDRRDYQDLITIISKGEVESGQIVIRCLFPGEDTYRYYENWMGARKDTDGKIIRITGMRQDVTEKNLRKQEIENARKSLELAMDAARITAWTYDVETKKRQILYGNYHIGSSTDLLAEIHPEDKDLFMEHFYRVYNGEVSVDTILARIQKGKDFLHFESTISSVLNEDGKVVSLIGSLKDMTETLSDRRELRQQKEFVTVALEAGNMAVWMYDIPTRCFSSLEGNALAGASLSYEQNLDFMHPDDHSWFIPKFQSVVEGRESKLVMKLRYKDPDIVGGYRHYESTVIPIHDEAGVMTHLIGTQKEVTNDYFQQEELRQSKQKTDLAIQGADLILWEYDRQTRMFTCYNEPLNGYDETRKLREEDYFHSVHPDDLACMQEILEVMRTGQDQSLEFDARIRYADDTEWRYTTISGSPFERDSMGVVTKYVGLRKDNTQEQKKRALLNAILDNVPVPIHIKDVDNDYRYVFWNEESRKLFGDATFKNASNILDAEQTVRIHEMDRRVFDTEEPYMGQERIVLLDGREYETIARKSIIYDGDKKLLLCVRWDIGMQNELQRKSKILSSSMNALNAFTWYYDSRSDELVFGDGFDNTGGTRSDLNNMAKFAAQIHRNDRERYTNFINDFMRKNEGDFSIEYRIDLANKGKYEWWECRGTMETITRNDVTYRYMYGMDINIDAHKRIEMALLKNKMELARMNKQNELVLNNANSGLVFIAPDYVVQWENLSVCSSSLSFEAYKKGELCYKSARNRTEPCEDCVMQRAFRSRQMEQMEIDFPNGSSLEVFATPVIEEDGEIEGVVLRVDDITERKRMISDLKNAKMLAERSDKLKSAFLANMSHEIRTPLNAIVGFSELLMSTTDVSEQDEYRKIINTNNELLLKLINDILDLSKIEAGFVELKCAKFDLAESFNEIAAAMRQRITNPSIEFVSKNPYRHCIVELDRSRLTQILTNYVTNAIKYTAEGFIEMGYEYEDGALRMYVKDSGIGISVDKRHKVFHRFEKLDEFAQGTGLGLSICKAIAEAFGGKVGFNTEEGVGSTFWVSIPCQAEIVVENDQIESTRAQGSQTEAKVVSQSETVGGSRKTILVAEDIASNYLLVSALLKKDYNLIHAVNGHEALEIVRTQPVDIVLMDMKMPVMDGLEATARIRKINGDIPIVALTAHAFETDIALAMDAGCNEYLVKPVDKNKLFSTLRRFLSQD